MNFEEDISGKRLVSSGEEPEEIKADVDIRPRRLNDYIGQEQLKKSLGIFVEAACKRGEPLDHTLFHGFPGLGFKTRSTRCLHEQPNSRKSDKANGFSEFLRNVPARKIRCREGTIQILHCRLDNLSSMLRVALPLLTKAPGACLSLYAASVNIWLSFDLG